ncbi:MAG: type 4a pilus biogenesis protein PilO [Coriobacteriia bacterium]|nr:type 4a pilus biogenesis protein PilO [Coriobacteriia bacterium]MBN2822639.1 type 4a pilus biogenesis protein PilO [Coriobacteriia bacterium]
MNKLSSTNQMIIAGVLILLVTVAVVAFGIMPLFQEASDIDTEMAAADTQMQTAEALVQRRLDAKARSAENEVALMQIANQLPESPELPSVIIELQDTANATGLDFVQITPAPLEESEDGTYQIGSLVVVLHGEWADIIEYTRKIDKLSRGVRTTLGSFERVEETDEAGLTTSYISAQMTLEVYVMGSTATAPAAQ